MAAIHILSPVLRCRVVKHLRWRFEPPKKEKQDVRRRFTPARLTSLSPSMSTAYRLQDCHRHLKFCPAFLICSGGAAGLCCAERWGLWLPADAGWGTGGGDDVTVGCQRIKEVKYYFSIKKKEGKLVSYLAPLLVIETCNFK